MEPVEIPWEDHDAWFAAGAPHDHLDDSTFYTLWMIGTQGQRARAMRVMKRSGYRA